MTRFSPQTLLTRFSPQTLSILSANITDQAWIVSLAFNLAIQFARGTKGEDLGVEAVGAGVFLKLSSLFVKIHRWVLVRMSFNCKLSSLNVSIVLK
ncbi:hypothetical protein SO802_009642 [Lithocarpus litseifolius]|uniref:Uncharacterized protein n=1 Tax=Lithocarpus litseifolius TaxID=425828 RepID=A0AAW2DG26_9ROSI